MQRSSRSRSVQPTRKLASDVNDQGNQGQGNPAQSNACQGRRQQLNQRQQGQSQKNNPEALPKNLRYDDNEHWLGFKDKFLRYMIFKGWKYDEVRDQLCWCLEQKTSEYHATLMQRNDFIEFHEIMDKLQKRFGNIPQADMAQEQSSNLTQLPEEEIEDWADNVQQLPIRAFPDLQEQHMIKKAIKRICHGCVDREAGQHVVNLNLTSIEIVVDKIKRYQFNHKNIYSGGHHPRREMREESMSPHDDSPSSDYEYFKVRQAKVNN
jgi:hypothetical protein